MNVQQLKYVAVIANSGSFREAAKKLYVTQPSLSHAIKELESELGLTLFNRTNKGITLTEAGVEFLGYTENVLAQFERIENRYLANEESNPHFSIASQHYDFLSIVMSQIIRQFPTYREFRLFESTTLNVIQDVEEYRSELGLILMNDANQNSLERIFEAGELVFSELITFKTHVFMRKDHPLNQKKRLEKADLVAYPQVRFTQETSNYTYYAEDLVDFPELQQVISTSDRATLNGILLGTDAYATGSGIVREPENHGLVLRPLQGVPRNRIGVIQRKNQPLTAIGTEFLAELTKYLATFKFCEP